MLIFLVHFIENRLKGWLKPLVVCAVKLGCSLADATDYAKVRVSAHLCFMPKDDWYQFQYL